jgi:F-type H+-transporting ATPase subunit b
MDRREQEIAARIQEAEERRREAEEQKAHYRRQRRELEEARDEKMAAVQKEVEEQRKELLAETQQDVARKKEDWRAALQREQDNFLQELRQRVGSEAVEVARRALRDLADAQLERQMTDLFVERLQELDSAERDEISESIRKSGRGIVIHSAFELPEETQQRIIEQVRTQILDGHDLDARFERSAELISGIEMYADSYRVGWTVDDYLAGLEAQIRQTIEQETQQQREDEHGS